MQEPALSLGGGGNLFYFFFLSAFELLTVYSLVPRVINFLCLSASELLTENSAEMVRAEYIYRASQNITILKSCTVADNTTEHKTKLHNNISQA